MQDKQNVERPSQSRIGLVLLFYHFPQHVHEILCVTEIVVRINVGEAEAVTVAVSSDRRDFADETINLEIAHLRIEHISGIRINSGECRHSADEHAHRVSAM